MIDGKRLYDDGKPRGSGDDETSPGGEAPEDRWPQLAGEYRWYSEHTALLVSTFKWAMLSAACILPARA